MPCEVDELPVAAHAVLRPTDDDQHASGCRFGRQRDDAEQVLALATEEERLFFNRLRHRPCECPGRRCYERRRFGDLYGVPEGRAPDRDDVDPYASCTQSVDPHLRRGSNLRLGFGADFTPYDRRSLASRLRSALSSAAASDGFSV